MSCSIHVDASRSLAWKLSPDAEAVVTGADGHDHKAVNTSFASDFVVMCCFSDFDALSVDIVRQATHQSSRV